MFRGNYVSQCNKTFVCLFQGKSKRGELSIFPKTFIVLSPCVHMMPRQKAGPGTEIAIKVHAFGQQLYSS